MSEDMVLGPEWEAPLAADKAARMLDAEPSALPELPVAIEARRGCKLYMLTDFCMQALHRQGGYAGLTGSVAALGVFDGVHEGHRTIIDAAIKEAESFGVPSVIVTFDPDPSQVLRPDEPKRQLLDTNQRLRMLAATGVDALFVVPFDQQLAETDHNRFLGAWLATLLGVRGLNVGEDFRMGKDGLGTVSALGYFAAGLGIRVHGHKLAELGGEPITASRVRSLLGRGNVREASWLLGRYHCVRGTVEHGRGQGAELGFATANVACDADACLPREGVYAGFATVEGSSWPCAINVGAPRTFGGEEGAPLVEATLLGFEGDLYGKELEVCFVEHLRDQKSFESTEELVSTVKGNIAWVAKNLGEGVVAR